MYEVAVGSGASMSANFGSETATVGVLTTVLPMGVQVTLAYLTKLDSDHWTYYSDVMNITGSAPQWAGMASAAYSQYEIDEAAMTQQTQQVNTLVQTEKGVLSMQEQYSPLQEMEAFENFPQFMCNILLSAGG
jgi:hypothetical protein